MRLPLCCVPTRRGCGHDRPPLPLAGADPDQKAHPDQKAVAGPTAAEQVTEQRKRNMAGGGDPAGQGAPEGLSAVQARDLGRAVVAALEAAKGEMAHASPPHPAAWAEAMMARLAEAVQRTAGTSMSGPLNALGAALQALRHGDAPAWLQPASKRGRAPATLGRQKLMRAAADMVTLLRATGVAPRRAEAVVAAELDRAGLAQTQGGALIQAGTVRRWYQTADAPPPHMAFLEEMRRRPRPTPPRGMTERDAQEIIRDMAKQFATDPNLPKKLPS
jgi:hypothetical protein